MGAWTFFKGRPLSIVPRDIFFFESFWGIVAPLFPSEEGAFFNIRVIGPNPHEILGSSPASKSGPVGKKSAPGFSIKGTPPDCREVVGTL